MAQWVYTFGDGKAEGAAGMKNLLGGKGANLAEMSNLGLPVPPGFTITTEVCTYYYDHGRSYPAGAPGSGRAMRSPPSGACTARTFGDAENPLLVSVRSGARASMPGMMDTVLNLGLNDVTVEALAKGAGDQRFAYDSYRRFITMYSNVVLGVEHHHFEEALDEYKERKGYPLDTDLSADDWKQLDRALQGDRREGAGQAFPAGSAGAALGRHRRRVRLLDERARHQVPRAARHPGELGHGGQRAGDGVRQHGRDLRHRRRLHAQPVDRREASSTASSSSTRRARTWWRASARRRTSPRRRASRRAPTSRRWNGRCRRPMRSSCASTASSKGTTATCRTWNSRSRRASSGCSRPATASAPPRRRCASRSNSRAKGLISQDEAVGRVDPAALDQLLHPTIDPKAERKILATGLPASPGAASGEIVFSSDDAEAAQEGRPQGHPRARRDLARRTSTACTRRRAS